MNEELKTPKDQPTSSSPLKRQHRTAKLPKWREGFTGYPSPPGPPLPSHPPSKIIPPEPTTSSGKKAAAKKSTTTRTITSSHPPANPSTSTAAAALRVSPSKAGPSSGATTINPPPLPSSATAMASGSQPSNKIHSSKKSASKPPKAKKQSSSSYSVPTAAQKELETRQRLERDKALQAAREAAIDKQAINVMTRELHIPLNKAKEALDETKNEAKINAASGGEDVDLDAWVEAAQVWLAMAQELRDEHILLGEAMEVSLAEAEQRRQKIKPIEERTAEEIAAAFESSSTMKALVDDCNMAVAGLFGEMGGEMRKFVIEWLTLEQNCKKWYAVSRYYFDMVAEEIKAVCVNDSDGGNVALHLLLGQKINIVKQAVFTMPEVETTAGWVPQLFLDAARGKEEDVVEILD